MISGHRSTKASPGPGGPTTPLPNASRPASSGRDVLANAVVGAVKRGNLVQHHHRPDCRAQLGGRHGAAGRGDRSGATAGRADRARLSSARRGRPRLPVLLAGTDVAAVATSAAAHDGERPPLTQLVVLAVALLVLQASLGSYRPKLALSALDDLPTTLVVVLGAGAVEASWLTVLGRHASSEAVLGRLAALALSIAVLRAIAYAVVRTARRRGHFAHPTLVLGGGDTGRQVAAAAAARPEHGLAPLGIVGTAPAAGATSRCRSSAGTTPSRP